MITIAEHTIEETLLPKRANILDLGARGFLFANELRRLGHHVFTVDIDPDVDADYQCAIAGEDGYCGIIRDRDPQATRKGDGNEVQCYTLETFSKMVNVEFWDVLKVDIEGAEYEMIMSLTKPPATQISIEFHCHTGIYNLLQVSEMVEKLRSLGYNPVFHEFKPMHGMGGNYWDSLFILR